MSDSPSAMHPWGEPALRLTLMPRDTNAWGTIFGGVILSYIDLAGGVEARKYANHTFVTVAMREVVFHEPVFVGDLVSFYTRTERVGVTSVTVKVIVEAIRGHEAGRRVKVTEAEAVYVAIDETRRPIPIQAIRRKMRAAREGSGEPVPGSPASLLPLADPLTYPDADAPSGGRGKQRGSSGAAKAEKGAGTTRRKPARPRTGRRGQGDKPSVRRKPGR